VVLKFKTRAKADQEALLALYAQKLEGKDVKGICYTDIVGEATQELLIPGLAERVGKGYHAAKQAGKLDKRSTTPKKAVKVEATVEAMVAQAAE
jgi:hypothetical protein